MSYTEGGNTRLRSSSSTMTHDNVMTREGCQKKVLKLKVFDPSMWVMSPPYQLLISGVIWAFLTRFTCWCLLLWCAIPIHLLSSWFQGQFRNVGKTMLYRSTLYWSVMGADGRIHNSFILRVSNSEIRIKQLPSKAQRKQTPAAYRSD